MYKKIGFVIAGLAICALPLIASADTLANLQAQLQSLLSQIKVLQQPAAGGSSSGPTMCAMYALECPTGQHDKIGADCSHTCVNDSPSTICPQILRSLSRGSTGSDVMSLQAYLGVSQTGYFGPLTASAVAKFQASEGLSQVGIVGPLTRAAFARRCGNPSSNTFSATPTYGSAPLYVSFSASGKLNSGSYVVDFGDGQNSGPLQQNLGTEMPCYGTCPSPGWSVGTNHTYTSAGTYTATLSPYIACVYSNPGCTLAQQLLGSVTITVTNGSTVNAPSISGVDGPTTLKVNQQGTWSVHVTDASGYLSYSVRWGNEAAVPLASGTTASASIASSGTFTHTYTTAGTYSPTFTVTNGNGQSATASATVVIDGTTNQAFYASPTSGTVPFSVTFSGWGTDTHVIDFGDGNQQEFWGGCATNPSGPCGLKNVEHTYVSPGPYNATLYKQFNNPHPSTICPIINSECGVRLATVTITATGVAPIASINQSSLTASSGMPVITGTANTPYVFVAIWTSIPRPNIMPSGKVFVTNGHWSFSVPASLKLDSGTYTVTIEVVDSGSFSDPKLDRETLTVQ